MRKPETIAREIADVEKLAATAQDFAGRFPDDQYLQLNLREFEHRKQRLLAELQESLAPSISLPAADTLHRYRTHLQALRAARRWTLPQLAAHVGWPEDFLQRLLDGWLDELAANKTSNKPLQAGWEKVFDFDLLKTAITVSLAPLPTGAVRQASAKAVYSNHFTSEAASFTPDFDCVYG
jgi:hypothetical protein